MSLSFEDLVDRVYEAAAVPELWSSTLAELGRFGEGSGALLFTSQGQDFRYVASPELEGYMAEFMAGGWVAHNDRPARLFAKQHAGFLTDLDVYTHEELDANRLFTDFLRPRGFGWGAATAITVPSGERIVLDVERAYRDGPVPADVVKRLDAMRPHLARAATLSARLRLQAVQVAADVLEMIGLPAAVLGRQGQALAMNRSCQALLGTAVRDGPRFGLADSASDRLLAEALLALAEVGQPSTRSIPIPAREAEPPAVAHVLPVKRSARDLFTAASAIVIVTHLSQAQIPSLSVLEGLFDLTPAEARVARGITGCRTVEQIAKDFGTSPQTVRSQLKSVMAKTGVNRQVELVSLLSGAALLRL
ncbi:helix-turn-helix transcriptional regulator [Methylorubrum aminovorans]|nr:helix-turn-helix transcriptional regulator [Methylobacterium sp. DM1]